jgi:nitrous oxide reductase
MCFAIRTNKPIIIFYNDLDKAKQTRLDGLKDRKQAYSEQLVRDEKEIKKLKSDLEEFKLKAEQELEDLANQLRGVKAE